MAMAFDAAPRHGSGDALGTRSGSGASLRWGVRLALVLALAGACRMAAPAGGPPTISLTSSRFAVLADGRDYAEIIAEVRDSTGRFVPDGVMVSFSTNLGLFADGGPATRSGTRAGVARIRITSQQKGTATITASVPGGGFQRLELLFTDDPAETFQGNAHAVVTGRGSLLYAAAERVIEALSRPQNPEAEPVREATVTFRNVKISAERLQVDCLANRVRASGSVLVERGKQRLECVRLSYDLLTGKGYAVVEQGRALTPVTVEGPALTTTVSETGVAPKFFEMADLSEARLIIVARQIRYFPGDRLQFTRPRFYEDGGLLFSLPYYSLGLYSNQLFSEQFLSVGTQGVGVDFPLYYDLTPVSRGVFRLRYGERYGNTYARRPGFAMDVIQSYESPQASRRFSGELGFTGLTRGDWGFRWTHSHELGADTLTSMHLDFPQHRSMFGSANVSHRAGRLRFGLNASAFTTLRGLSSTGTQGDFYVETAPAKLSGTPMMYSFGGSTSVRRISSAGYGTSGTTHGLQARAFAPSLRLDGSTTLSMVLSANQFWRSRGPSGAGFIGSLNAVRTLGASRTLQLGYDYAEQPGSAGEGRHRVSLSLNSTDRRWNVYLYNTLVTDTGALSVIGDMQYSLTARWRLGLSAAVQRYQGGSYTDIIGGIAYNIGGRDVVLSYSTFNHRIMLDLQATSF